jgi:hypothetical protein
MMLNPALEPITAPVPAPMIATPASLLLQLPPAVALPKSVVLPAHSVVLPTIDDGSAFTVTTAVF